MRAVDTNVLVRLITRDDPRQAAAAETFIEKGAWVSVLALAEATWVLSSVYELGPKSLARAIEMLLNHRELVLQDAENRGGGAGVVPGEAGSGFFRLPDASASPESRVPSAWHFRPEPGQG